MFKSWLLKFIALAFGGVVLIASPCVWAQDSTSQQLLDDLDLGRRDVRTYKKIFEAIKKSHYAQVDKLIKKLDNDLLLGNVLAEKYLSSKYKTSPKELEEWIKKYSDHPQVERIYKLAVRKKVANLPDDLVKKQNQNSFFAYNWPMSDFTHLNNANKIFLHKQLKVFRRAMRLGKTKRARLVLENNLFKKLVPAKYYSNLALSLATRYLTDGYNKQALEWARISARKNKNSSAYWTAGLAAWQMKHYKTAATEFKQVSAASKGDEWISSAGDFWAARAYKKQKNVTQTKKWLESAAAYKRTFYGILASYKLGMKPDYNWSKISYFNDFAVQKDMSFLLTDKALKRILALIFVNNEELARKEMENVVSNLTEAQKEAVLYLADYYQMHSISMMLSQDLCSDDKSYDHSYYPLPEWEPESGWKLEPALVWALSRQESSFRPYVISPAGACGLMQLLPSTAAYISGKKSLKRNRQQLFNIQYNLKLGQDYVRYLLEKPIVDGNLLFMLTAYNAGPGNLAKWLKKVKFHNDPLLYMEIIPSRETRIYMERVMSNYWIYQIRLDEPTPTLKMMANDKWPIIKKSK